MAVAVVDDFELVEVHEDQHGAAPAPARVREELGEADVEPAVVVEAGQVVALGQLVRALGVERVLEHERGVAGEDLQQGLVALRERGAVGLVDQLEDAADVLPDVDRHADDGVRLVAEVFVDLRVEIVVGLHVGGDVRRAVLVDLPDDAVLRGEPLPDEAAAGVAERGDEDELVLAARGHFAERVVEEDRARLGGDELVGLLQDLPEDEIEVDDALEREPRLLALQKPLQLRDFEGVKLNHVGVILARALGAG